MSKVKDAKADLEKSPDPGPQSPARGSARNLAALYDRVPGWPIGFGDADKAEQVAQTGLATPTRISIDRSVLLGRSPLPSKTFSEAKGALQKALQAQTRARPGNADAGRPQEIEALLVDVNKKLGDRVCAPFIAGRG